MDRNSKSVAGQRALMTSLSARRAWIEILVSARQVCLTCVALRKESVDRNFPVPPTMWSTTVALRKESVDRNSIASANFRACTSRSPQGERG